MAGLLKQSLGDSGVPSFRFFARGDWLVLMSMVATIYMFLINGALPSSWISLPIVLGGAGFALAAMFLIKRAFRVDVEVGLDGLRVRYGLLAARATKSRDRFIPFASVRSLQFADEKIELEEEGRPPEQWHGWTEQEGFRARIDQARRLAEASKTDAVPMLATPSDGDYRSSAYPKELLLRVVEDPTKSTRVRVAAAVAIRADLDEEDRARVRDAAMATASRELRTELESIMESERDAPARLALRS